MFGAIITPCGIYSGVGCFIESIKYILQLGDGSCLQFWGYGFGDDWSADVSILSKLYKVSII